MIRRFFHPQFNDWYFSEDGIDWYSEQHRHFTPDDINWYEEQNQ